MKALPLARICLGLLCAAPTLTLTRAESGADIAEVFARARRGEPLRYVALGGSITQDGKGWIGPWLEKQFPESAITVVNSGMSATGSSLGIFRVDRDVIAHQPDLVAIEYCVNDGGLTDEQAIRFMESLVVRLKSLPHPPAILILEAASEGGVNLSRHSRVARHYGLAEIDLQAAADAYFAEHGLPWSTLFIDRVHPNREGHKLYAETISKNLQPLADQASEIPPAKSPLPPPLSEKPLLLDGRMVPLSGIIAPGWSQGTSPGKWWDRFFLGTLVAREPATALSLPLRGTFLGLFYEMDPSFGTFYANIDGGVPRHIQANSREGYSYSILGEDLPAGKHSLTVVLPSKTSLPAINGPIELGYALVAGESAKADASSAPGPFSLTALKNLHFAPVSSALKQWSGPYFGPDTKANDARAAALIPFPPESADAQNIDWKPLPPVPANNWIDLQAVAETKSPGVVYLRGEIGSPAKEDVLLGLSIDYYGALWLNGKPVLSLAGPHGGPREPTYQPVTLQPGKNEILVKVASGSAGFGCSLKLGKIEEPEH